MQAYDRCRPPSAFSTDDNDFDTHTRLTLVAKDVHPKFASESNTIPQPRFIHHIAVYSVAKPTPRSTHTASATIRSTPHSRCELEPLLHIHPLGFGQRPQLTSPPVAETGSVRPRARLSTPSRQHASMNKLQRASSGDRTRCFDVFSLQSR